MDQVAYLFRTNLITISALLIPTFTLIAILAPGLVQYVLGEPWQGTEQIIQVLAVVGILGLVTDVAVPAFQGLGHPFNITLIEGAQSLVLIFFVYEFTRRFGLMGAAFAWIPAILGSLTLAIILLHRLLLHPFARVTRPLLAITFASLLGAGAAIAINLIFPTFLGFILSGLVGVGSVACLTWLLDHRFELTIGQSLAAIFPQVAVMLGSGWQQKGAAS